MPPQGVTMAKKRCVSDLTGCGRVWGLGLYEKQYCEIIIPTVVSYHTLRGFLRSALPWLLSDWSVVCTRLSLDTFKTRQGCMGSISADDRMFIRLSLWAWSIACYKRKIKPNTKLSVKRKSQYFIYLSVSVYLKNSHVKLMSRDICSIIKSSERLSLFVEKSTTCQHVMMFNA